MTDLGVIGPPWRVVEGLTSESLSLDPPALVNCDIFAAFSPRRREMLRCSSLREAETAAKVLCSKSGGDGLVLHGGMRLCSGLWYFPVVSERVNTAKALDPLDRRDRAVIADRLSKALTKAGRGGEAAMLREALGTLDVEWGELSDAQTDAIFAEVRAAARGIGQTPAMNQAVKRIEPVTVKVAADSRKTRTLEVSGRMGEQDRRLARRIAQDQSVFITDDYGRRASAWVERDARKIIASGARRGIDDKAIAKQLHGKLGDRITGRTEHYFRVLANSAVVRSSSFGQLTGYRDSGIERYEWNAVMDGPTCAVCRFLHGQVFTVNRAFEQFNAQQAASDPQAGIAEMPWFRQVGNAIHVGPSQRGGELGPLVATVLESAVGQENRRGTFDESTPPQTAGSTTVPPAHGLCRCITLPAL